MPGRQAPFVGRADALGTLADALGDARASTPVVLVVEGEAGIGKTRLVSETVRRNLTDHDVFVQSHGVQLMGEQLIFGTVLELVRGLSAAITDGRRDRLPASALRLLDACVPERAGTVADLERVHILDGFLGLVESLSRDHLVWLAVDDVQWTDESSRDALRYLVRPSLRARLVVSFTVRTSEALTSWLALVSDLKRGTNACTISLRPLGPGDTAKHAATLLGRPASAGLLNRIVELGQGIPFLNEELVLGGLRETGALPTTVEQLMLDRIGRLPQSSRRVVEAAALEERAVRHDDLRKVLGLTDAEVDDAVEAALAVHVLDAADEQDTYRFHHALLREAVAGALRAGRRRDLHRRWAETLDAQVRSANDWPLRVAAAHHWAGSGDDLRAFEAALSASELPTARQAPAERSPLLVRVVELWDRVPDAASRSGRDRDAVVISAIRSRHQTGDWAGALQLLDAELGHPDSATDQVRRATLTLSRQGTREQLGIADAADMPPLADLADLLLDAPTGPWLPNGCVELGWRLTRHGDSEKALRLCDKAIEAANAVDDPIALYDALDTRATVLWVRGDVEAPIATLESIRPLVTSRLPDQLVDYEISGATYRFAVGDLTGSTACSERALDAIGNPRFSPRQFAKAIDVLSMAMFELGRWDEADQRLEQARSVHLTGWTAANLDLTEVLLAAYRGRLEQADVLVAKMWARIPVPASDAESNVVAFARHAGAATAAVRGDLSAVRSYVLPLLSDPMFRVMRDLVWRPMLVAARAEADTRVGRDLRRLGSVDGRAAQEEMAAELAGARDWACPPGALTAPFQAQLDAELARIEGRSDPDRWLAAVEAWGSTGQVHDQGWAQLRLAESLVAADDRGAAVEVASHAFATAGRLGAAPLVDAVLGLSRRARLGLETNGSRHVPDPLKSLTAREIEVLRLVATGKSNDEIGQNLFISPKTASVHVSHILAKLQVSSRTEAAARWHRAQADTPN
jgi:DNA-binding CsgD family transcriptional regulator